jgi:ribosomal protein S5
MREYKVMFDDNRPVHAMLQHFVDYKHLIKVTKEGNKRLMQWLVVVGEDEKDAIKAADHILHTFWEKYLNQPAS